MGDPLSVAGSAVGIASLGIQVCQGLESYLRSVKGRKEEIANGLTEVQTLASILLTLKTLLSQNSQQTNAEVTSVKKCLTDSGGKLVELQQHLIDLRGPELLSTGFKDKAKDVGRSIIYPFQEGKLKDIQATVWQLRDTLHLANTTALLGTSFTQLEKTTTIEGKVKNLEALSQVQNDGISNLGTQATQYSDQAQDGLARIECVVRDVQENMSAKFSLMQLEARSQSANDIVIMKGIKELFEKLESKEARFPRMDMAIENESQRINPSAHSVAISSGGNQRQSSDFSRFDSGPERTESLLPVLLCKCPRRGRPNSFYSAFGNLKFGFEEQPSRHRPGCKLYGIERTRQRSYKAQFLLKMGWFCARMRVACIDFTTGAGGLGFSMRCRNIVEYSPVQLEIEKMTRWMRHAERRPDELIQRLQSIERTILSLYRDGKSSPYDEDVHGQNNASVLLDLLLNFRVIPNVYSDNSVTCMAIHLIQTLHEAGRENDSKIHLPNLIQYSSRMLDKKDNTANNTKQFVSTTLENYSATLSPSRIPLWREIPTFFRAFPGLTHELDIPPIFDAISSRSMEDLNRCIMLRPDSVMEELFGCTTLQLCVGWPFGLQRLLETKAKSLINSSKYSPTCLEMASETEFPASVHILMQAGCHFDYATQYVSSDGVDARRPDLDECIDRIAANLAQRRKSLLALSHSKLGLSQDMDDSTVADDRAAVLCKALRDVGITVPAALDVPEDYSTIYHCVSTPIYAFETFKKYGFGEYTTFNSIGLTPIMARNESWYYSYYPSLMSWIKKEGLGDQKPKDSMGIGLNTSATGWHYVASLLARYPFYFDTVVHEIPRLSGAAKDHCACWCSAGKSGCSPLTLYWKSIENKFFEHDHVLFHHDIFTNNPQGKELSPMALDFVRLLTFEALDMTHTCCSLENVYEANDYPRSPGSSPRNLLVIINHHSKKEREAMYLEQEEKNAQVLNDLMVEFAQQMMNLEPSRRALESFVRGYWSRHISQLYVPEDDALSSMKRVVADVKTHILPERLQNLLGEEMKDHLLGMMGMMVSDDESDHSLVEREADTERMCGICDRLD